MNQRTISTHAASCLPRLAATAFICLAFGANTHVDAANTVMAFYAAPLPEAAAHGAASASLPQDIAKNLQVLSPKDADLYRAAFVDQERSDWKSADIAIANLTDRRLVGHVLADRYQRRSSNSGADLRSWLVSYGNLPEAPEIYDQASRMPGVKGSKVTHPTLADSWSGTDSYGSSLGFRPEANDNDAQAKAHCCTATINRSLRHGDPYAAKAILETELKRRAISANELAAIQAHIATGFFYEGETAEARRLTDEVAPSQNALALWINGLAAWKQNDMEAASQSFTRLAALPNLSSWDRAAGAFWAYRALQNTGEPVKARYWLEQSAKQPRSFYGFLATQLLNRDGSWSWQLPELNSRGVALLTGRPAGWRALALLQIGQPGLAESELHHLNPQGNHDLQEAMLALAEKAHMPSLAVQLGGLATNDNGKRYDAALYPLPPWQPEQGFQVDRALMYALMRHESQFDPTAVSGRGACGLMQLMPATANLMANDTITSRDCSDRVLNPAYNMALGQKYVKHLASQPMIGDNLLMLLAAYNSGPNKLARWMDDDTKNDPLLFIESLPARETRDYVQQVLIYYWNYRARLGQPETSLTQLAHGQWPHYALNDEVPAATRARTKRADVEVYDIGYEVVADSQR